ncbi:LmeA family phospholipid-binding protein [Actinomyces weissii]|uniref:LmeA family phospholipid-binding protein n=1 Tax=Actinomyces weissii TaxID=675090 RepID=A0A7T7M9S5_9ACTO|nr:LmeA family phospholipid-binding protein [Actinomyces weissii]QQM67556.1 LmeA family phospholipid-binding protein [Actinomyces weissii]
MPEPEPGRGHLLPSRLPVAGSSPPASADTPDLAVTTSSLSLSHGDSLPDGGAPPAAAETQPLAAATQAESALPGSTGEPVAEALGSRGREAGEGHEVPTAATAPLTGTGRGARPRRRRRPLRWLAAVSVLLLCLGGAFAVSKAESIARHTVQQQVLAALPGLSADAVVDLGAERMLPQLWDGELRGFTVTASSLQVGAGAAQAQGLSEPVTLSGIRVQVTGMGTRSPHQASSLRAGGSLSWEQLSGLAAARLKGGGSSAAGLVTGVELQQVEGGAPDSLRVVVDVPAATFAATGTLSIDPQGDLLLSLSEVEVSSGLLSGVGVPDDETFLEQVGVPQTMTVLPASALAQGLKVESVETTASGVSVVLSGQDVALDNLGK